MESETEETIQDAMFSGVKPDMVDMFEEARRDGLWFFAQRMQRWWSPQELAEDHRRGYFRWGRGSFHLRDPQERLDQLRVYLEEAESALQSFTARLEKSKQSP